ncbi:MAG: DNA polymerase/3'-5' exonuclease PolX [Candidatus Rokubacteria bacterium]|nr:DNA polymerase/3'-5' exonuclease PolX [Candidatus Rokubacteria bacterium]
MKNFELARLFDLMADILEIKEENPFRIRAYRRAAQNLESLTEDVEALAREERLEEIPGVGKDLAGKIVEYLRTGRIKDVEAAKRGIPGGVVDLMNVPGIGPKTAKLLYEKEGITTLDRLEKLARAGKLRGLHGIQAKTEANILKGIALVRGGQARMPLGRALPLGQELVRALGDVPGVKAIELAGSLRRMKETVGDIDVLATSTSPAKVMHAFTTLPQVAEVLERGETKAAIRHREGIQVDLRVLEPECFGAALAYFTGSKQHNIRIREMAVKKGLKISEYGVFRASTGRRVAGATEEEVYAAVGLPWIPPELREDLGEVEAAAKGRLPDLVALGDIRGDLHCHTKATDGSHTIDELVAAAETRGYEYVVVTDHSLSARVAGGLSADELAAHVGKIRAVQPKHPRIAVLAGSECDILADGAMDYSDDVLARLDLVIGGVHSRFKQPRREMTKRICRALANPYVSVLAHPTGRLIGEREPYDVDLEEVFRTAKQHGKAVEINAYPSRLDLNDVHARRARDLGVLIAVNTDAHVLDHLSTIELGVATARRAWVEKSGVVNTWPAKKLLAWARSSRPEAGRRPLAARGGGSKR